jgi:hypothetical protein
MFMQEQLDAEDPSSGGASRVRWARHGRASRRRTTTPTNVDVSLPLAEAAVRGRNEDCSSSNPLQLVRLLLINAAHRNNVVFILKMLVALLCYITVQTSPKKREVIIIVRVSISYLLFLFDDCPSLVKKEQRSPAGMGSNLFFNCSLLHSLHIKTFPKKAGTY